MSFTATLADLEPQKLETYDTEQLITIQVGQLEKEKKEMNERLTRISKRIDHIERAYRKEERPLLAKDYEQQQETDRRNFEALQEERKTSARQAHEEAVATKKRLLRMREDYEARRAEILARKGEEFSKRKEAAARKIEEEKAKRRKAVLAQREEERKRLEEEERIRREQEEEEMRLEEGEIICAYPLALFADDVQSVLRRRTAYARRPRPRQLRRRPPNAR